MSKWSDGADLLQKLITAKEVAPIQGDLINLQQTMFALQSDQMKLIDENQKLKEQLKVKNDLVLEKGVYWQKNDKNKEQPFCPVCYAKGKIVPLQKHWEGRDKTQSPWSCPAKECKAYYNPWDYKEPESPPPNFQPFYTPGDY